VGSDAQHALTEKLKVERKFEAKAAGVTVVEDKPQKKMTSLTWAVTEYLGEIKGLQVQEDLCRVPAHPGAVQAGRRSGTLEEIERKDMLEFVKLMVDRGYGRRTQANRVNYIKCFFNRFGLKAPLLKTDKIRYTQKAVAAYSTEELKALFAAANQEELELFQFFLCTGARDGEVQHACWSDLVNLMKARRDRSTDRLILPGTTGKTEALLRILKASGPSCWPELRDLL
jgi:hypothetical protein